MSEKKRKIITDVTPKAAVEIAKPKRWYWVGVLEDAPIPSHVHVGGICFPRTTCPPTVTPAGVAGISTEKTPRFHTQGDYVPLTDEQVNELGKRLRRSFLRIKAGQQGDYGVVLSLPTEDEKKMRRRIGSPMATLREGDKPLADYIYFVPVGQEIVSITEIPRGRKTPPPISETGLVIDGPEAIIG